MDHDRSQTPASDDTGWLAEAAMHRVLRRTLAAQRHDALGPLSALRLLLATARRRARHRPPPGAAGPPGAAAGLRRHGPAMPPIDAAMLRALAASCSQGGAVWTCEDAAGRCCS